MMSEQSIIVWDLETIPDLAAAARMLDMPNASEKEVREALGSGFPKHPLHHSFALQLMSFHSRLCTRKDATGKLWRGRIAAYVSF